MTVHTDLTPSAAADRLAIRELFDAYAHCADRRDAEGQKALFTPDTRFAVYMDGAREEASYELHGREALAPWGVGFGVVAWSGRLRSRDIGSGWYHPTQPPIHRLGLVRQLADGCSKTGTEASPQRISGWSLQLGCAV
jgi:hypothetical protein